MLGENQACFFLPAESDMPSLFGKKTDLDLGLTPRSGVSWLWLNELIFFRIPVYMLFRGDSDYAFFTGDSFSEFPEPFGAIA